MTIVNDLSQFWMPFTANRQYKAAPRLLVEAKGIYYRTIEGREVLDGTSGLWCCNVGHGDPRIVAAIQAQAMKLDFAPTFQMGHPAAFELSSRLTEMAPAGFDKVFFCNSGSEAVDTALKLALAYQRARGQGTRTRLIASASAEFQLAASSATASSSAQCWAVSITCATRMIRHATASHAGCRCTGPSLPTISSGWSPSMTPPPSLR
jgi:adenosylmethionine-8-amino-7-oxononanoate aminotransferase